MARTTPIDKILDLDDNMMMGPPQMNNDLTSQLNQENHERESVNVFSKIRHKQSNQDLFRSMNGGEEVDNYFGGGGMTGREIVAYNNGSDSMVPYTYYNNQPPPQQNIIPTYSAPKLYCLDIVDHIENCPLCRKFHSTDKSIYYCIIIALFVIILIFRGFVYFFFQP